MKFVDFYFSLVFAYAFLMLDYPSVNSRLIIFACIVELYADRVGQWPELDQVLLSVKATVDNEADHMQQLMEVLGTMDTLFASSQASIS